LGWLFAGRSLTGALLLYVGPCLAWALLPSLFALSGGWLYRVGWNLLLFLYLPAGALISTVALRAAVARRAAAEGGDVRAEPSEAPDLPEAL